MMIPDYIKEFPEEWRSTWPSSFYPTADASRLSWSWGFDVSHILSTSLFTILLMTVPAAPQMILSALPVSSLWRLPNQKTLRDPVGHPAVLFFCAPSSAADFPRRRATRINKSTSTPGNIYDHNLSKLLLMAYSHHTTYAPVWMSSGLALLARKSAYNRRNKETVKRG